MADSALLAAGGADAPLSYTVPGLSVIRIKQAHVSYVDNGAGGDWLPAVRIVSDSGHRMGTASDQGVKVTAGNDADVSFFPGVKPAAAAVTPTGTSLPWGMAKGTNFTIAAVGTTVIDFTLTNPANSFGSSGDGTVTLGNVGGGTQGLILNTQGVYQVSWHVFATSNAALPAGSEVGISCDWDTGDTIAGDNNGSWVLIAAGPAHNFDVGVVNLLDLDPANYPIPNTGRITLKQNTGNALGAVVVQTAYMISTVTDPSIL